METKELSAEDTQVAELVKELEVVAPGYQVFGEYAKDKVTIAVERRIEIELPHPTIVGDKEKWGQLKERTISRVKDTIDFMDGKREEKIVNEETGILEIKSLKEDWERREQNGK